MNPQNIKIGIIIIVLILGIIAVSTNYWSVKNLQFQSIDLQSNIGLWKACEHSPDNISCFNTTDKSQNFDFKHLQTIKILSISSLVLIVLALYLLYSMPKQKEYYIICLVLAGILSIISVILWNNEPQLKQYKFNNAYSFYLELSSGIIAILLGLATQFNVIA